MFSCVLHRGRKHSFSFLFLSGSVPIQGSSLNPLCWVLGITMCTSMRVQTFSSLATLVLDSKVSIPLLSTSVLWRTYKFSFEGNYPHPDSSYTQIFHTSLGAFMPSLCPSLLGGSLLILHLLPPYSVHFWFGELGAQEYAVRVSWTIDPYPTVVALFKPIFWSLGGAYTHGYEDWACCVRVTFQFS